MLCSYIDHLRSLAEYKKVMAVLNFGSCSADLRETKAVQMLAKKIEDIQADYKSSNVQSPPQFSLIRRMQCAELKASLEDYTWARIVVVTRTFGMQVNSL